MKRMRQFETEEQTATSRSKSRVVMKRKRQSDTEEQTATARSKNRVATKTTYQSNTEEQIAARRCQPVSEEHNDDITNVINQLMKEAKKTYTGHQILQIPLTNIGGLCVSYVIVS
jgi:hypothetical protein